MLICPIPDEKTQAQMVTKAVGKDVLGKYREAIGLDRLDVVVTSSASVGSPHVVKSAAHVERNGGEGPVTRVFHGDRDHVAEDRHAARWVRTTVADGWDGRCNGEDDEGARRQEMHARRSS